MEEERFNNGYKSSAEILFFMYWILLPPFALSIIVQCLHEIIVVASVGIFDRFSAFD